MSKRYTNIIEENEKLKAEVARLRKEVEELQEYIEWENKRLEEANSWKQ